MSEGQTAMPAAKLTVCRTAQTEMTGAVRIVSPLVLSATRASMLLIIGALVVVSTLVGILRVLQVRDAAQLGWMSERWLAEHRATHAS